MNLTHIAHTSVQYITIDAHNAGQRLDNFLIRQLKGVPKTHIYRIIRSGEVRINKARAKAHTRLQVGDTLRLPPVRVAASHTAKKHTPAREFDVLYEDAILLAINKPAGVAVHGGSGVSFGVIEQLRSARVQQRFLELIHRLDRETSGVLLVAKKRSALTALQAQFRQRTVGKTYLALVQGAYPENKKVIDTPLYKYVVGSGTQAGERRVKTTHKDDPNGMKAVTLVRVAQHLQTHLGAMTLLEVRIKTGRTHQIRVHLASQGCPIVGDDKYGDFAYNKLLHKNGLPRMFLHAWELCFTHPSSAQAHTIQAALPAELDDWMQNVR